ncbi:MAG: 4Fe-4S binding protein [Chloroflexi bacterium]|nr:4Fe-4S binding protein [Chloroflexota bacterium]
MSYRRIELTREPIVKRILTSRWLQWSMIAITLPVFLLAILAGGFGTPAGSRNFGIVFVWVVWWAFLILLLLPLGGRLWCAICPIPAPGEWLQRRALVEPRRGGRLYTLGLKWPRRLANIWLQSASFLTVALFSVVILTTPSVSALVLALFAAMAVGTSLLFERRTFCRYLCPVGGFIGLYSQLAPVEIRARDRAVCMTHKQKTCYVGSAAGYGCPWLVFPGALEKNTYCGLCTECLKTCPLDNVGVFVRPFGADLLAAKGAVSTKRTRRSSC